MTFTPDQIEALNAPLDRKHIKPPKAFGPKGDYLEAWHVINEANRIFGYDGWSYEIDLRQDSLVEGVDKENRPQWQAAYTCICTLTVGNAKRQDVGFGSGFAKAIGDAIEGATKEAATDALKRALRTFGNQFGLALYDKDRANVCDTPVEPSSILKTLLDGMHDYQTTTALKDWLNAKGKPLRAKLNEQERVNFDAAYTNYKAGLAKVEGLN